MTPEAPGRNRLFALLEIACIVLLALVPLFTTFPYRVNIFLSWEGAYRMSQGEVPYRDFGMPLGYMYWVIPALFFKLFGAQLITLVKAQVFINILSGLAFRSILRSLGVPAGVRLLSVVVYCVSYSFFNFWPWYNHTVIVYEFIGIAFLLHYLLRDGRWIWLSLAAAFTFFSFFTKQDGGALGLLICLALLGYDAWREKRWKPLLLFGLSYLVTAFALIAPLLRYNFGYWFNHGQPPHTARISLSEIADEFFSASQALKFYLLLIVLLLVAQYRSGRELLSQKRNALFLLLTLGILAEAAVIQVTSYTPPDNNIFYHAFAFAFLLTAFSETLRLNFSRIPLLVTGMLVVGLWWSGVFWKYVQRITQRSGGESAAVSSTGENVVNRHTYMINTDTTEVPMSDWTFTGLKSFEKVYLPRPTVEGIRRLMAMPGVKGGGLKVLNMTELTPLARELPYEPEKGPDIPLWYHLGVAMFNREAARYEQKIVNGQYDLVLFEYIPTLNNFYPFRVRDTLLRHYNKVDSFFAPRRGAGTNGTIEVFVKP